MWRTDTRQEYCAYCKLPILEPCITCAQYSTSRSCPPITGVCEHTFHRHCVQQWTAQKGTCPVCSAPWQERKVQSA